ncbi:MAG: deoxyribose-phosphate aldolase [Rikenellaceae bacterium]
MKKTLSTEQIARMVDISAVKSDSATPEIEKIIEGAIKHNFICVFAMPSFTKMVVDRLADYPSIKVGGIVGFPSGGETSSAKVFQAKELIEIGCDEVDMVINVGKLKSGLLDEVLADIKAVREVTRSVIFKVIMEVALLTDEEIQTASKLILEAGADFVKTGTGWAGATTMHHVKLIKESVGDKILLKVAGGVRDLDTLLEMEAAGVSRFGIGHASALKIMEDAANR